MVLYFKNNLEFIRPCNPNMLVVVHKCKAEYNKIDPTVSYVVGI